MDINGPVNLYYCVKNNCRYYLFSDIHIPIIGICPNSGQTVCDYLKLLFDRNVDQSIELLIENRIRLFDDDDYSEFQIPLTASSNVIQQLYWNLYNSYEKYFCPIDIRYGIRDGKDIQRTIFSCLEKITRNLTDPPLSVQKAYFSVLRQLYDDYDNIVDYYLNGQDLSIFSVKTVELINSPLLNPPFYEELYFKTPTGQYSPLAYQFQQMPVSLATYLKSWLQSEFQSIKYRLYTLLQNSQWRQYDFHQFTYQLLFTLFDGYVLSKLLTPSSTIKILYVGGRHVDTYVSFLSSLSFTFTRFGYPDTDQIINDISKYHQAHPYFRQISLSDLLPNEDFQKYIRSKIPSFQCPRLPPP